MKSLIYRHTIFQNEREVTIIYILGVPVFKRVIIDKEDRPRRACGSTSSLQMHPVILKATLMMKPTTINNYGKEKSDTDRPESTDACTHQTHRSVCRTCAHAIRSNSE